MPSARQTASQRVLYGPDGTLVPKGYVYLLVTRDPAVSGDHAYIKIGHSIDPITRVKQLKTGLPLPIERLTVIGVTDYRLVKKLETHLHRGLKDLRAEGEWFRVKWNDKAAKDVFHRRVAALVRERVFNPIVSEVPVHALSEAQAFIASHRKKMGYFGRERAA